MKQSNEKIITQKAKFPRILLGATSSGSGKTAITCGILQALVNRGMSVSSFKCGPDYIDPMFHSNAIGTSSSNLDLFFSEPDTVRYLFTKSAKDSDISVIEGVMGYYDGISSASSRASAYEVSVTLDAPAILIVDSRGASTSVIATILGFLEYKKDSHIKGVILNRMSEKVYQRIKNVIENDLKIDVLGYVPSIPDISLESRHLGLVTPDNIKDIKNKLNLIAEVLEKTVNIDKIIEISKSASSLECQDMPVRKMEGRPRIAIAKDEAFCFMYRDNLELLEDMGAQIEYFSPIHDECIPASDGVILYGGYPELYAEELSRNSSMIESIKKAVSGGMPCIAECGGFMYLHDEMEDPSGTSHSMCGIISGRSYKTEKLVRFGYVDLKSKNDSWILKSNETVKAHEFHYWDSSNCGSDVISTRASGDGSWECIHCENNVFAGYPHIFYRSCPDMIRRFLEACINYRTVREKYLKQE